MSTAFILHVGLLLTLYLKFNFASGITRSAYCPIACYCSRLSNSQNFRVKCINHWNEIPPFSINVSELRIRNGNFGLLTKPKNCKGLKTVKTLNLPSNKISEVAGNAFECVPRVETIILSHNSINVIQKGAFAKLAKLENLFLTHNKLTADAIDEIATITELLSLSISDNGLTLRNKSLEPLARSILHNMDMSNNVINGTFGIVTKPLRALHQLTADMCHITSLQRDTFARFNYVQILSLKDNPLNYISNFTFVHLTSLQLLDLSGSIQGLSRDWLDSLPPLEFLLLKRDSLKEVPRIGKTVKSLHLDENNISSIDEHTFNGFKHLQYLHLRKSRLFIIHSRAFRGAPQLTLLNLRGNRLLDESLANLSASLVNTSIKHLDISENYIPIISPGMFIQFSPNKLTTLEIAGCKMKVIKPLSFKNFNYVQSLKLSGNKLTQIARYTFAGMYLLHELDLSSNKLNVFYKYVTKDLNNLVTLKLQSNNIYDLGGMMMGMKLKNLDFGNNKLKHIGSNTFANTINIEVLSLKGNQISHIKNGTFSYLSNITNIDLSNNKLSAYSLHLSSLSSLIKLVDLELSSNEALCKDPHDVTNIIVTLTEMTILTLTHCSLKEMLPNMFKANRKLEKLNLASNKIPYLEPKAFGQRSNIHTLILTENSISYVADENFVNLPALRELHLEGNPLLCTCEVLFIVQAVKTNVLYMGRSGLKGMRCQAPDDVRGKSLAQIHMDLTDCENPWTRVLIPIGSFVAGLIVVFISLNIWRYRWHFKYFWFLAKAGRRRYHEIQDDRHYEFDAFVAYSERDLWWVRQHLLPNLEAEYEGQGGLRFCVHHRDWLAGRDIVDNIAISIEQSRRTIIVLSDNFATSQWCQYELAIAQLRLDTDGTCRELLVMILLNDISSENLTPRLTFILTSKTYLPWSDDPEEQALFWGALRRSLSGHNTTRDNFLCFRGNEA